MSTDDAAASASPEGVTRPPSSASSGSESRCGVQGEAPAVCEAPSLSSTSSRATVASELAGLLRAHNERQAELRAAGRRAWEEVQQRAEAACDAVVGGADAEVSAAFAREKKIEMELKAIATRSAQLQRQMTAWATLFGRLNTELKEVGDVSNWARRIEEDLSETVHVLEELAERRRREQGAQRPLGS
ncbi:GCN5-like protein [Trypanosoma conorhini]|uniref:Biogenesis of lysosome-related organelles complex 1 subunit 1 n=1 Tax=Trypanosoma conorhini TaxID=83891 RepID=A0A3R7LVP3_9TRYP|nr:GCN5-like protein [Trypanosoma conorhini]RNF21527.1 GCN5-like protein [Trypanosoma conorhini]